MKAYKQVHPKQREEYPHQPQARQNFKKKKNCKKGEVRTELKHYKLKAFKQFGKQLCIITIIIIVVTIRCVSGIQQAWTSHLIQAVQLFQSTDSYSLNLIR